MVKVVWKIALKVLLEKYFQAEVVAKNYRKTRNNNW